jgi:hypothetical protein
MIWAGLKLRMHEIRSTFKIFVGKPEGKGQLGRHVHRREDKNEENLKSMQ